MRKDVLTDKKHRKLLNSLIFDSPLKKWSKNKIVATIALTKIAGKTQLCNGGSDERKFRDKHL